ncbi:MAG: B12-binding domain-containing radical SAM protein [candidate division WS1 bacterium]|nr:B12-binding domain-containing radical SAM protein [candidate division WS1 bacterium]
MKTYLVAPGVPHQEGAPQRRTPPIFPPLGLMTVAALTPPEHQVSLVDESVTPVDFNCEADVVGLTATTAMALRAYEIADRFRARGVKVVMGGMHASALPREALQHVDAVVVGEAEELWPQALQDLEREALRPVYRHQNWPDPAGVPPARRDLLNPHRYIASETLQAARGCPFACSFCAVSSFFGRTYRTRPVEDVVAEAASLRGRPMILVDDNIMGHPAYATRLFERLADLKKQFLGQASTTMLKTPELISKAAAAGCRGLFVGLESISPSILARLGKAFNVVTQYRELVKRLHDNGISIIGSFMFGLDGEDPDVFNRTMEFAEQADIDMALFSIVTPLPGTRFYEELQREGRVIERDWSKYDGTWCTFAPRGVTADRLQESLQKIYRDFYSWGSILKRTWHRFEPMVWLINSIYHRRVRTWLYRTRQGVPYSVAGS